MLAGPGTSPVRAVALLRLRVLGLGALLPLSLAPARARRLGVHFPSTSLATTAIVDCARRERVIARGTGPNRRFPSDLVGH